MPPSGVLVLRNDGLLGVSSVAPLLSASVIWSSIFFWAALEITGPMLVSLSKGSPSL